MVKHFVYAFLIAAAALVSGCDEGEQVSKEAPRKEPFDPCLYSYTPPEPEPVREPEPIPEPVPPPPSPPPPPPKIVFRPLPPPPEPKWPDASSILDEDYARDIHRKRLSSSPNWAKLTAEAKPSVGPSRIDPEYDLDDDGYKRAPVNSGLPVGNDRILANDRWVAAVAETTVNSQVPGSFVLQTIQDVYGYHDRNVLIPKGSRIVCEYESLAQFGETRLPNKCTRILRAGDRAEIYRISSYARDAQGGAGMVGEVDNRVWERYGSAILVSAISAMATAGASFTEEDSLQDASTGLSDSLAEVTAKILEQTISLEPIIRVVKGTIVYIKPDKDWFLSKPRELAADGRK